MADRACMSNYHKSAAEWTEPGDDALTRHVVLNCAVGREETDVRDDGIHARVQHHFCIEVDRVNVASTRRQNVARDRGGMRSVSRGKSTH